MNRLQLLARRRALPLAAAALLAACGGGGGSPSADTVRISGRAVDGPLQGATACYDLNDNGACEATEPTSAATGSDGAFVLDVAPADSGRHAVVVQVPAHAVDADTGAAVGQAFVMRAPASGSTGAHNVFVSPLSTLVLAHMVHSGAARGEATEWVRTRAGLALSPLADFTRADSAGSADGTGPAARQHAARVARLAQLTALEQAAGLAALVGTPAHDGQAITAADIEREVQQSLLAALPAVAAAAAEPDVAEASGAALQTVLLERARSLAAQAGLDAATLRLAATMQRLAEPPASGSPVATAALTALRYTNADNWFMRTLRSSADDNTTDVNGYNRYADVRLQSASPSASMPTGVVTAWARGANPASASHLHWSGSAWLACTLTDRFAVRARDTLGRSDNEYCNGLETATTIRRVEDVSGLSLQDVVRTRIRTFPGSSSGVTFASWGPSNLALLGSGTFAPGSSLVYQTNTTTSTAPQYDPSVGNQVQLSNSAVSAGGDARSNPSLACNDPAQYTVTTPATTLEDLVSRMKATPCIYNQSGVSPNVSLPADEWWGNSTLNVGDLAGIQAQPVNTGTFYSTTASLRVSFVGTSSRVRFWRCYRISSNNSPRNCALLGLGTWNIQTLGDARVLSFSTPPALAQRLGSARVFVERGGFVYYGNKAPLGAVSTDVRLNLEAANSVTEALGLPRIRPVTKPGNATGTRASTLATLRGAWGSATATEATVFRFGDNGRFFMAQAKPEDTVLREQTGAELGWIDHDATTGRLSTLLEVDSNLTTGTSHPRDTDPPVTITADLVSDGTFNVTRLPDDPSGLVGLWALDSATDLSVTHFVFYANNRLMVVVHKAEEPCLGGSAPGECPPGAEYAEYSFDPSTGALRAFNLLYDTNGCQGLFDRCPTAVSQGTANAELTLNFSFAPDRQSLTFLDRDENTRTLHRIAPR